jgi:hypothetical protein
MIKIINIIENVVSNSLEGMYHASNTPFEGKFDIKRIGTYNDLGYSGKGFYFTPDFDYASNYIISSTEPTYVREFNLYLDKPYFITNEESDIFSDIERGPSEAQEIERVTNELKEKGYDGVIRYNRMNEIEEVCVFDPDDIIPAGEWKKIK